MEIPCCGHEGLFTANPTSSSSMSCSAANYCEYSLSVELKCLDCSQKSLLPSYRPSCCLLGPVAVILVGTVLSCVLCCLWHRVVFCTVLSSVLCCPVCRVCVPRCPLGRVVLCIVMSFALRCLLYRVVLCTMLSFGPRCPVCRFVLWTVLFSIPRCQSLCGCGEYPRRRKVWMVNVAYFQSYQWNKSQ